ncbi:MAG: hypothetical protein UV16_C0006G0018 [candidate division WWE3 bacterium GW2011_GWE2_42_25]|nr:MAG: hypothetical protein UV16_C0006G0018 [candidate division WWE3 bacterium GW2011_GWE2_42_25]
MRRRGYGCEDGDVEADDGGLGGVGVWGRVRKR